MAKKLVVPKNKTSFTVDLSLKELKILIDLKAFDKCLQGGGQAFYLHTRVDVEDWRALDNLTVQPRLIVTTNDPKLDPTTARERLDIFMANAFERNRNRQPDPTFDPEKARRDLSPGAAQIVYGRHGQNLPSRPILTVV